MTWRRIGRLDIRKSETDPLVSTPIFVMQQLAWVAEEDHNRLVYHLPKPMPDGRSEQHMAFQGWESPSLLAEAATLWYCAK